MVDERYMSGINAVGETRPYRIRSVDRGYSNESIVRAVRGHPRLHRILQFSILPNSQTPSI